jgi:acyl-CoA synthetase (AMP-forming)/AMP-acid ligase II
MLDRSVERFGSQVAVVDGRESLTFEHLQLERNRVARALTHRGVGDGTHVGIFMKRSIDYVVLLHALWAHGAVAVPLNTTWQADEIGYALRHGRIEYLVAGASSAGKDLTHVIDDLGLRTSTVSRGELPDLREVISEEEVSRWRKQAPQEEAALEVVDRQVGLMLFTSGTASRPKAVVLRQDGLLGTAHHYMGRLGVDQSDRFMSLGPYFHAGGIVQLLGSNLTGATHYLFDGLQPSEAVDVAIGEQLTVAVAFDPVLTRLLDEFEARQEKVTFRKVGCAPGTATYPRLRALGLSPVMMYAMTEGGNMITLTDPSESEEGRMSNGYPLPGVELKIVDPADGSVRSPMEEGEICFKGWNLFAGYFNDSSVSRLDEDGYFHTGDYGWIDEDGRLFYRGRYSAMIKTGGENVSEAEVEHFLVTTIPSVRNAAVVGMPDDKWGEAVVAFVEVDSDADFDEDRLRALCRDKIAGYKIPKRFVLVRKEAWPVTQTGKIVKPALRQSLLTRSDGI